MKICVLGLGNMGSAIAAALAARSSHQISVRGSRAGSATVAEAVRELRVTEASEADMLGCDVVFVVVPWAALEQAARALNGFRGIVVSVVVPWGEGVEHSLGAESAAERLAALIPSARIANAFTSVASSVVREPGDGIRTSIIVCSDDAGACETIMELAKEIGFDGVNGGGLKSARYAEAMGLLCIAMAYDGGYGERVTFHVGVAT